MIFRRSESFWKISKICGCRTFLVDVILVYNRYSDQPVCNLTKRGTPPPVFSGEIFENGWLWMAASEQSKIAACNVIQFLTIKICFGIIL